MALTGLRLRLCAGLVATPIPLSALRPFLPPAPAWLAVSPPEGDPPDSLAVAEEIAWRDATVLLVTAPCEAAGETAADVRAELWAREGVPLLALWL